MRILEVDELNDYKTLVTSLMIFLKKKSQNKKLRQGNFASNEVEGLRGFLRVITDDTIR